MSVPGADMSMRVSTCDGEPLTCKQAACTDSSPKCSKKWCQTPLSRAECAKTCGTCGAVEGEDDGPVHEDGDVAWLVKTVFGGGKPDSYAECARHSDCVAFEVCAFIGRPVGLQTGAPAPIKS